MGCPAGVAAKVTLFLMLVGLLASPVLGITECEELAIEDCAFAVSSSGARCVLEKVVKNNAAPQYKCQTSIIMAERPMEWIESEDCIRTCGLQRLSVGLSTDALLEGDFTKKLCFSQCRSKCPNINDLYTKLAAEEGIYLPSLCDSLKPRVRKLGAEQRQEESQPQEVTTAAVLEETKVEVSSQTNAQSLQISLPVAASPTPPPSAGWPVMPPPYYPVAEEPYPAVSAPTPVEAEPPYYYTDEYPWLSPTAATAPAPAAAEPAPAAAPYLYYDTSPSPSSSPFPSPTPSYYGY